MDLTNFAQYGIAFFAIGSLITVMKVFMDYVKARDKDFMAYVDKRDDEMRELICNHLEHERNAINRLEKAQEKLTNVITQLLSYLRKDRL